MDADALVSAAQWDVSKALAPVADDDMLERWAAIMGLRSVLEAIRDELQSVRVTLEMASGKQLGGPDIEEGLRSLRDSVHNADDLLDELDYFCIQDGIKGTYHAADMDPSCLSARAVRKPSCSPSRDDAEASGWMHKLGKLLPCSSSPHPLVDDDDDRGDEQETPKLEFNRVDFSQRATYTIEQLKILHNEVNKILQSSGPKIVQDIAQTSPVNPWKIIIQTKMYGRDNVMNNIIHDITKGQYCDKGLTVLPIVGPGKIGKTTLMQHIYNNQQVRIHFPVSIWIRVSFGFNLAELLEEIKRYTPAVEGEKECNTTQELIEHRLKCKRFLLVLDDMWKDINEDDWGSLLSTLNKSQEKGSMILLTTQFPAIAHKVQTTSHSVDLNGIESEEFRKLFLRVVFGEEECPMDKQFLLETGDKIMEKLKGSFIAAKLVGTLLSKNLSLHHWRRALESKEWERKTCGSVIIVVMKLQYDFLPFHLQQCFAYSALFPEDFCYRSKDLIRLWIGLDILIPSGQNQTFEDIGLSYFNELVSHGFFREVETDGDRHYVIGDLLHDLALEVATPDVLSLRLADNVLLEIQPSTRHLSMSTEDLGEYNSVSGEELKRKLDEMKTRLKVEHLQTLVLFGEMDENFANIFADFFSEASALRVLHLPNMTCPVESLLHNFSGLVYLRYLCLGTKDWQMHLPLSISKFYHLRILDLELWKGSRDLPEDMSNLAKLCHFYVPSDGQLHSDICNVGKLKLLEELKVFQVNKKSEGFEPKQLEHLTKLRELGIYNLEKIHTKEEAAQAKLIERNCLKKLTLDWDSEQSIFEPGVEAVVLEGLQPHKDLQELCIRGHSGPCPTWLGDKLAIEDLQSLCLIRVSWKVLPSVGKMWNLRKLVLKHIVTVKEFVIERSYCRLIWFEIVGLENFEKWVPSWDVEHMFPLLQVLIIRDCPKLLELPFSSHIVYQPDQDIDWFPKLQELEIERCPELLLVPPIPWTKTLCYVGIRGVMLLEELVYSNSFHGVRLDIVGNDYLHSLDQVLAFNNLTGLEKLALMKCPPLELKHRVMLTSLNTLNAESSDRLVVQLGGQGDVNCLPAPPVGALHTYGEEVTDIEHARFEQLGELGDADCLPALPVGAVHTYREEITDIELVQILCKGDHRLKIHSVVGFGGSGKTTLAKAVYDKLKMQFDCRSFVPVSRNPDMKRVFMHILYDLHEQNYLDNRPKNEEQLIDEIKFFLQTKRYLIVFDDLWDTKSWDVISLSLPSNDCGSRVITTTCINKIAEKCCSENKELIYKIMPLGYENSKQLFLKKCSGSVDSCRDALTEVDDILKMCSGMPLAITSIASAIFPFSAGKIKEQYQEMMKSLHYVPRELHCLEKLTMILSYSYSDLPKSLRDCLLYLAASAKNQIIQRDNLVRKWIAEGLIPKDKGCSREEEAIRYFDELTNRNVIQPVKYVHCLGKETYEVTYMMLYALRLLSQKENFATYLSRSEPHVEVKPTRLFIQSSDSELPASTDRVNLTNVRSVTMLGPANPVSFKRLKNVQLLDLDCCKDLENSAMDDICLMIKLKYLSLKLTKVTALPPQIGKLQNLETLDVSRTQISNLPPEIGKLQSLITLDASKTQISNLPPEISNLQSLETLDVRQTQVKELPKEVLQLCKIKYLHFGQSGWFGVKLPVGIDQLESVQVMGIVDSRECSESAVKEISELIPKEVKELQVVMYDGPADMVRNDKLLSSVGKCSKLKSLTIYGDSNPSDELSPKSPPGSPYFPQLEKLKVAGRFVKVPGWIAQLTTLTLLVIRVGKLEENDLVIIGGLPCLSALTVAPVALPRKQVNITSSAGFARLEVFCIDCRMPWVSFWERAMPNLKELQLKLYSGPADKVPSGIMLLERLNTVILLYSSQYAGDDGVTETVAVIREDAASHANQIELFINGDREIFSSNRSADMGVAGTEFVKNVSRVITETEIEEVLASE